MIVATTRAELSSARAKLDGTVGVVMTMGALHEGHDINVHTAQDRADHVIVTIFVNPLQFGPNEDFDRYPRPIEEDLARCERLGVDVVFAPSLDEMYPSGDPQIRLNPGPRGEILEGASRPGFFHGVLTVVMKLLQLTRPDFAFFGEKDFQHLSLIRQMVADLNLPVEIVPVPTRREPDGLAKSSRNRYLTGDARDVALALSASLHAGVEAAGRGLGRDGVLSAARSAFDAVGTHGSKRLDYLVLTAPDLGEAPETGPARLLIAAWVGDTRLIDNIAVEL
ncbi:MAG TPA: pantoate--beta-alanine ligase [Micromonosporaceae bacterium]